MINKFIGLFLLSVISFFCEAQTFSGYIKDKNTEEAIIGASIFNLDNQSGCKTNNFGFFSITNITYPAQFKIQSLGYLPDTITINSPSPQQNFYLKKNNNSLKTVVIKSQQEVTPQMQSLSISDIKLMPTLAGEPDVLKSFQLLPGVQGGREGTSGLHVRGGSADQNLILLDDIPLYNVNHIGGFFSIFDVNAINSIDLIKGSFPAKYGGRLSSVLDIRMKEGNASKFEGNIDLGVLTTRASIQGPITSKTKFILSLRRCNIDLPTRAYFNLISPNKSNLGFTFYDAYSKITHQFNANNKVNLSVYNGRDRLFFGSKNNEDNIANKLYDYKNGTAWGNLLTVAKWTNSSFKNLFINTTAAFTKYYYTNELEYAAKEKNTNTILYSGQNSLQSSIQDFTLKTDATYYYNKHTIRYGLGGQQHTFQPSQQRYKQVNNNITQDTTVQNTTIKALEFTFYIEDEMLVSKKILFRGGLHGNNFSVEKKNYFTLQPRANLQFTIDDNHSMSAGYSVMNQNVHLLSNIGTGIPVDLWLPATANVSPAQSKEYSAGFYKNNILDQFNISIESYYKTMSGLIDFSDGQSFFGNGANWEDKIQKNGKGEAYGAEFFIKKTSGNLTGFLSYTHSYSNRKFDSINAGAWYPYKFDRRHNFNINLNYPLKKNIIISANFVFQTGHAITLPSALQPVVHFSTNFNNGNNYIPVFDMSMYDAFYYGGRNQNRMPNYHRLDVAVHFNKQKKNGERNWNISIYNAYGRLNPYYLYFDYDKKKNLHLYQFSLFPFVPSVSYSRSWH